MNTINEKLNGLFREEAIQAKQNKYGSPVKPLGISMRLAGLFFVLLIIGIVTFLTLVDFSRKESALGSLVSTAGTLKIIPSKSGVVTNVFVKEGQIVQAGQALLEISTEAITSSGKHVTAQMLNNADSQLSNLASELQAKNELNNARLVDEKTKIENLEIQLYELQQSIDLQKMQIANLSKSLENIEILRKDRLISEIQYRESESKLLAGKQALISQKREMHNIRSQIIQSRSNISQLTTQAIITATSSEASFLQIQGNRLSVEAEKSFVLTAKKAGRVTTIRAKIGEQVQAGNSLAVIVPENAIMQAEIWVSSAAVPYIKKNTPVNIMYDAFPYQKFGMAKGLIFEIAQTPTSPNELPLDLGAKESLYRVVVTLNRQTMMAYGVETHLSPGIRLKSDLILDKRSLLEWFLEPVLASKSRL